MLTSSGNLLAGSSNANDDTLAPPLVAGLQGSAHHAHVAGAVEGVVAATVGHVDQLLLDGLAVELGGVDKVGGTELAGPHLLAVIDIDDDDLGGLVLDGTLDDGQTYTAGTEDGNVGALLDTGSHDGRTVPGGDAATQQTRTVGGDLGGDGDHGDVGDDGVLREGGGAHEVQKVLAADLETRGTIGHDTLTLGGTDLPAEVGLAGLAELALAALGGVQGDDILSGLDGGHAIAYGLDNTGTFVTEDDREGTFGVFSGEGVGVCVADTGVVDLNANLMGLGGCNLDILDGERLASSPGDGSLFE